MSRLVTPAAVAALFFAAAPPAHAQNYYTPGYGYPAGDNSSPSFHWYGVPNGGLDRSLGSGTAVYPSYNFGGYRSTYYSPSSGATWNSGWNGYSGRSWGSYGNWNSSWSGRRGWRR